MSTAVSVVICDTCRGIGQSTNPNSSLAAACPTCAGQGVWLTDEGGHNLAYTLTPAALTPPSTLPWQQPWFSPSMAGLSGLICLGSYAGMLSSSQFNLTETFWQNGPFHALFGLSGLSMMWFLAHHGQTISSPISLHNLPAGIQALHLGETLSLNPYTNSRVTNLLHHTGELARNLHYTEVGEFLLLVALLREPRIQGMLSRLELSASAIIDDLLTLAPPPSNSSSALTITASLRLRVSEGIEQAANNQFPFVDLEDLVLGYLKRPGAYTPLFEPYGLTYDAFYAVAHWYAEEQERRLRWAFWLDRGHTHSKGYMNRAWTALPTPFLDQYSTDLTRQAANGQVASATSRAKEVERCLEVLSRTKRNSLLLVGEPGVGKHTLLGALALRLLEENVPQTLHDKRLISVDLAALLSQHDQAEANIQRVIEEVLQAGNVILAIPDIHLLIGTSGGALDAASVLTTSLARGSIQMISTASYADYHHYVESNPSFSAALDTVEIAEVSPEQAVSILEEETPGIEARQHVHLTYPAIAASVSLAKRYMPDQVLPSSALTLIDEAASAAALSKQTWVRKQDIEVAVEKRTNTPVSTAKNDEAETLLNLEESLHSRIVGQEEAVHAVAEALRRARAGLHSSDRPTASFLFVGPTGVGKTELAKALAEIYFGSEKAMVRLDMSEYQDARSVYRLIGAPAADSDSYTEGGSLTQPIREHPFSLILLDELEKAYPDVLNLFLQLLDDGRLTENTGRTVHFSNAIIIATSNAAAAAVGELHRQGGSPEELQSKTLGILQQFFRPEFLNRFDRIVAFQPFTQEQITQVTGFMLAGVAQDLARQQYKISFDPAVAQKLGVQGFDPVFGARPLRRIVQDKVEGLLAHLILEGKLHPGDSLHVTPDMVV